VRRWKGEREGNNKKVLHGIVTFYHRQQKRRRKKGKTDTWQGTYRERPTIQKKDGFSFLLPKVGKGKRKKGVHLHDFEEKRKQTSKIFSGGGEEKGNRKERPQKEGLSLQKKKKERRGINASDITKGGGKRGTDRLIHRRKKGEGRKKGIFPTRAEKRESSTKRCCVNYKEGEERGKEGGPSKS